MKPKLCKLTWKEHDQFQLSKAGLLVDIEMPYIGASPEGSLVRKLEA